jgi:hypothetical protein
MNALILTLTLLGQVPAAPDYDFVDLGKKLDALNVAAARAETRLGLVETKVDEVLNRLSKASATIAAAAPRATAEDDDRPWSLTYQVTQDGKEHFYVRDTQGRSRHFERPVAPTVTYAPAAATAYTAPAPTYYTAQAPVYYTAPAPTYRAAAPGYFSGGSAVYTGGTGMSWGLSGGMGYRQVCSGGSCSMVPF